MTMGSAPPPAIYALKLIFLAAFIIMMAVYALRISGHMRSAHADKTTDVAHLVMALAMFAMFAWPNLFM